MVLLFWIEWQGRQDFIIAPLHEQNGHLEYDRKTVDLLDGVLPLDLVPLNLLHQHDHLLLDYAEIQITIVADENLEILLSEFLKLLL